MVLCLIFLVNSVSEFPEFKYFDIPIGTVIVTDSVITISAHPFYKLHFPASVIIIPRRRLCYNLKLEKSEILHKFQKIDPKKKAIDNLLSAIYNLHYITQIIK